MNSKLHLVFLLFMMMNTLGSYVKPKPHRHYYRVPFVASAMDSIDKKIEETQENLQEVLNTIAENKRKTNFMKKNLHALIDYGKLLKKEFKYECPVPEGIVDIPRGICLLHRHIENYGRTWEEARQYCLRKGGDLAQPSIHDYDYDDYLLEHFTEFQTLQADLFIGTEAVQVGCNGGRTSRNFKELPLEQNGAEPRYCDSFEYQYLSGAPISETSPNFRDDTSSTASDFGDVAGLSLPMVSEDGIEISNIHKSDVRGFLCEFKLRPYAPSFKLPQDHVDDSVVIDYEDIEDNEAPRTTTTTVGPSPPTSTEPPQSGVSDFDDECGGTCPGDKICNYVANRCEVESACSPLCPAETICTDTSASSLIAVARGSHSCLNPCPTCATGETCNFVSEMCETPDSCNNECSGFKTCNNGDCEWDCTCNCASCESCNPLSGRCEADNSQLLRYPLSQVLLEAEELPGPASLDKISSIQARMCNSTGLHMLCNRGSKGPTPRMDCANAPVRCNRDCLNHQFCNANEICEDVCVGGCLPNQFCNIAQSTCIDFTDVDDCCNDCTSAQSCSTGACLSLNFG